MSSTFDIRRFGKYFAHDITMAWQNAGVATLVMACMPVWFFAIHQLFSMIFTGSFEAAPKGLAIAAYIVSFLLAGFFIPVQLYGRLTDKRAGSNWILLPASRLEKFVSMLLVCCVVLPLVWLAVILGADALMGLVFRTYPGPVLGSIVSGLGSALIDIHSESVKFAVSAPWALYFSWCANILAFTLGAIFFRKNKIVYTFLTLMGIGILISMAAGIFAANSGNISIDVENISEDSIMRTINAIVYALYIVEFALLDVGIYLRIKTLKH